MFFRSLVVVFYGFGTFTLLYHAPAYGQKEVQTILKAENFLLQGDTSKAVTEYKQALAHFPQNFVVTKRLAELYYELTDYYHAILYTNIALDITDEYLNRQDLLLAEGKGQMSKQELEEQTEKKHQYRSDKSDAHHLKGLIRLKQMKHDEALEELDRAIQLNASNNSLYIDKATVLTAMGKLPAAKKYLHKAAKEPLLAGKAHFSLGNLFFKEKGLDSALYYYNSAIQLNPLFKLTYKYKGLVLTEKQRYREAVEALTRFIQLDDRSEDVFFRRAVLYNELGESSNALEDWTKVLTLNPENQEAWRNRGLTYFKKAEYELAVKDFDEALSLEPDQSFTRINRGYSYYLLNHPNEALEDLNEGIKQMPNYYWGRYFRALVKLQLRKRKEACKDVRKAIELGMKEEDLDRVFLKKCF